MDNMLGSKDFVTFRKTKNYSETQYETKYKFVNFITNISLVSQIAFWPPSTKWS